MENVEISEMGQALIENKALTKVVLEKMGNLTPAEKEKGEFEIPINNGSKILVFRLGGKTKRKNLNPV